MVVVTNHVDADFLDLHIILRHRLQTELKRCPKLQKDS